MVEGPKLYVGRCFGSSSPTQEVRGESAAPKDQQQIVDGTALLSRYTRAYEIASSLANAEHHECGVHRSVKATTPNHGSTSPLFDATSYFVSAAPVMVV